MRKILTHFDYFGVELHFLYDSSYKYHSSTGGIVFILFFILSITYIACNISSLLNRQSMSLIFYDKKIEVTDEIDLENFTSRFAYGFTCDGYSNRTYIESLFTISTNHITMNSTKGNRVKTKNLLSTEKCTKAHFYSEFNSTFETNGFEKVYCPNETNYKINGIYQDPIFRYFELTISMKNDSNASEIKNIFQNYECRLAIHYVETTINVYDYKDPIKRHIETQFMTLKFNKLNKMNIFYKLQLFDSYENYLFDKYSRQYFAGFAFVEQYETDKGYDRFEKRPNDYSLFGKIYMRASNERTIIQRKYMKLTEFAANMSSILSQILLFLYVILRMINRFYAHQSIIQKIFQYRKGNSGFKKNLMLLKLKEEFIVKKNNYLNKASPKENQSSSIFPNNDFDNTRKNTLEDIKNNSNIYKSKATSNLNLRSRLTIRNSSHLKQFVRTKSNVNFKLHEVVITVLFPCINYKKIQIKKLLFNQGFAKLSYQLDILTFLKKMQQIDLLNYILLEPKQSKMIHFLSKPSLSLNNTKDLFDFLQLKHNVDVSDKEIEEFYNYLQFLNNKNNKNLIEKRLFNLAVIQLNNLLFKQN